MYNLKRILVYLEIVFCSEHSYGSIRINDYNLCRLISAMVLFLSQGFVLKIYNRVDVKTKQNFRNKCIKIVKLE